MSNKKIVVLLGKGLYNYGWDPIIDNLKRQGLSYEKYQDHQYILDECNLGILLGYDRIVPEPILKKPKNGFVVFHSSDLPIGRGFAPIYYTLNFGLPLVQTLCFASKEVDAGNIIAKASYDLIGNEIENEVREIDDQLTIYMFEDAINLLVQGKITGEPQNHDEATWWPRRKPQDSKIDPKNSIEGLFNHLRALPSDAPAFFKIKGRQFYLNLSPEPPAVQFDSKRLTLKRYYEHC